MSMYQPQQAHYPPNYPQSNSGVQSSSSQLAAPTIPTPGHYPSATAQQHPMMSHRAAQAKSMPTGHGYLNGSTLPDYLPVGSLGQHGFAPAPPLHPQRHNSGAAVGSIDNLTGHHSGMPPPPQHPHGPADPSQQSGQRPPHYFINIVSKDLELANIRAYGLNAKDNNDLVSLQIRNENYFDRGAFGTVFQAKLVKENRTVAVKTVLQDKRYRNRELPLMKDLSHPNIVTLFYYYFSAKSNDPRAEKCLNLVMEFMPSNVSHMIPRKLTKLNSTSPHVSTPFAVKLVMYQIFRALSYIHLKGICHRDIKPNNLLLDPETGVLKVCDFGSAKQLNPGERNVSYICARYYRAPELLFGATNYTNMIDLWSTGIVFSELLLGFPLFYENSGIDQLVNIISKLGTPTSEEILAMNKDYAKFNLPSVPGVPLRCQFSSDQAKADAIDLISQLFQYNPMKRIPPLQACAHPYFDELREPGGKWANGKELPPLFDFTEFELSAAKGNKDLLRKLLPGTVTPAASGTRTPISPYLPD